MTFKIKPRERDPLPSEWDRWALEKLGRLVVAMRPEERPEEFWRPILDLGESGHMWLDSFLWAFFETGLERPPASRLFTHHWRAIIDHALASERWAHENEWWPGDLAQNWLSLMGLSYPLALKIRWSEAQRPLVRSMEDMYQRWAERCLGQPACAGSFIVFLATPAAQDLRLKGLTWLAQGQTKPGRGWFRQRNLPDDLAALLHLCWMDQEPALRQDSKAWEAFLSLLTSLAERQNRSALELQRLLSMPISPPARPG